MSPINLLCAAHPLHPLHHAKGKNGENSPSHRTQGNYTIKLQVPRQYAISHMCLTREKGRCISRSLVEVAALLQSLEAASAQGFRYRKLSGLDEGRSIVRLSLSKRAVYGIRLLRALARMEPGARLTAAELSETCNVPRSFIPAIVSSLHKAGLVACSPGRTGGCVLRARPEEISLLDVISALEGELSPNHCVLDGRECMDEGPCELHESWAPAMEAVVQSLSSTTIAALSAADRVPDVDSFSSVEPV